MQATQLDLFFSAPSFLSAKAVQFQKCAALAENHHQGCSLVESWLLNSPLPVDWRMIVALVA
jgi:hypothetical protein